MTEYLRTLRNHLATFLTDHRRERFEAVLQFRTRRLAAVLVDLYQQHNASAVLRTCEALGVQDVHIVETEHEFETNPEIALGTDRWLTLHRYHGPDALDHCIRELRRRGYQIAATVLGRKSRPVCEVAPDQPLAVMFGTEKEGLPESAIAAADLHIHLPMYGFVESFNVSVAAALCLNELLESLRRSREDWHLTAGERETLFLDWARQSIPGAEAIERRFHEEWRRNAPLSGSGE